MILLLLFKHFRFSKYDVIWQHKTLLGNHCQWTLFYVIRHSFGCSGPIFYVFDNDVLSRMSSSLLCIYLLHFSLPYSFNEGLIDLRHQRRRFLIQHLYNWEIIHYFFVQTTSLIFKVFIHLLLVKHVVFHWHDIIVLSVFMFMYVPFIFLLRASLKIAKCANEFSR